MITITTITMFHALPRQGRSVRLTVDINRVNGRDRRLALTAGCLKGRKIVRPLQMHGR
jgi:hypothetical protein